MTESENENDHFDLDHFDLLLRAPMIATHHWIISEDDYFNDFPQSRSLRARRETKERYTQTKEEINRKV
jgi:hypothetical protein